MDLNRLTIKEVLTLLDKKQTSSVEITRACLSSIKKFDPKIKACLSVCEKEALAAALEADKKRAAGERGALLGVPCLIKDNIMTKGLKTTAGSKILENYIAPYDATVIKKLKEAGAVILGKTNLDEFAHGASTENSAFFATHNPWDLDRVPGGSSGGSAAAVASDLAIFALGSDTGGSIRQPASFCNIVGSKPSYGLVSRFGLMAMTSSTDVIGALTKTVEDSAILLDIMAGKDDLDATSVEKKQNYTKVLTKGIKGLRIGVEEQYFTIPALKTALEKLKELGAILVPIKLKYNQYGVAVYYIITPAEVSSNLARFDGVRFGFNKNESQSIEDLYTKNRQAFGQETKRRIILGTYVLSAGYYDAYYKQAEKMRAAIKKEYAEMFKKVDLIATPTSPHTAFKIGEQTADPLKMYLEDIFLSGPSLAGLPAISIPAGFDNSLPIGLQLIASHGREDLIFQAAHAYEKATDWHKQKPQL
jgi:aspartyl-tRNA(Asn)/glutamyl-tRNA(Gln) amidotransferase subunit A